MTWDKIGKEGWQLEERLEKGLSGFPVPKPALASLEQTLGVRSQGRLLPPGSPVSCGHCLTAHYMHLSAAQDWFLPPLNWEMSFRVRFLTQKFINLLQWLVTFFFSSVLSPLSKNTYGLFSCHSLLFRLTCSQRGFLSSVLGPCLMLH